MYTSSSTSSSSTLSSSSSESEDGYFLGKLKYKDYNIQGNDKYIRDAEVYLDSNNKDINNPDTDVKLKAYVRFKDRYTSYTYAIDVEIDLDNRTIISNMKNTPAYREPLEFINGEKFIDDVSDILDG